MPRTLFRNKDFNRGLCNKTSGLFKKAYTFYIFYPEYNIAVIIKPREAKKNTSVYLLSAELLNKIADSERIFITLDNFETVTDRFKAKAAIKSEDSLKYSILKSILLELLYQSSLLLFTESAPQAASGVVGSVPGITPDASLSTAPSSPLLSPLKYKLVYSKGNLKKEFYRKTFKNIQEKRTILIALSDII